MAATARGVDKRANDGWAPGKALRSEPNAGNICASPLHPRCIACQTATDLAARIRAAKPPGVVIRLIDLSLPGTLRPATVFAVPTYVLDGRVVSLGNPDPDWLLAQLNLAPPSIRISR